MRVLLPLFVGVATTLVALCTTITASHAEEKPKLLRDVKTIVTLGDSITQAGADPGGYVWRMQHYLDALYPNEIKIINSGISGHKSTDMSSRFQRDVLDHKPDLVTISVGVNDVWHGFYENHPEGDGPSGVAIDLYRQKVTGMVEAAQAQGIRVVILTATVIHEDLENKENAKVRTYNQALREIARSHKCEFVNLFGACEKAIRAYRSVGGNAENLLTSDGVHMNPAGNQLMAHVILRGLGISEKSLDSVKSAVKR
ncbi:hypothetical protein LBMAG21_02050 [Armatimonadota bacterium]|nr:hypothetical protein LBMAG21_02050 [Armatimonadota bacterium]